MFLDTPSSTWGMVQVMKLADCCSLQEPVCMLVTRQKEALVRHLSYFLVTFDLLSVHCTKSLVKFLFGNRTLICVQGLWSRTKAFVTYRQSKLQCLVKVTLVKWGCLFATLNGVPLYLPDKDTKRNYGHNDYSSYTSSESYNT